MFRFVRRVWRRLPLDGSGVIPLGSKRQRRLQRIASRGFWERLPVWRRVPAIVAARLIWLLACPVWTILNSRRDYARFSDLLPALLAGLARGKHPSDTMLHLALARGNGTSIALVPDLPGDRQGTLLLAALGNSHDIALANDKLEMADHLSRKGLPVPATWSVFPKGEIVQTAQLSSNRQGKLLIKTRHGARAEGLFTIHCAGAGQFVLNGRIPMNSEALAQRLTTAARRDSLLVQAYIGPSAATLDLSPDAPVVIRAFASRPRPNEEASLASAMLKILPRGMDAPRGINELLLVPIAVETGILEDGILLDRPCDRWPCSPWTSVPVRGRLVPQWSDIRDMVIRASQILPATLVIGWDILLGEEGPVILEANTGISLFRAMLWHFENHLPSPVLADILP